MQDYWPIIQGIFWEGYRFTLDNPEYAGGLAISVWLLTAIFYSIRIAFVNSRHAKVRQQMQNNVEAAQQQIQQLQEEVAVNAAELEKEKAASENEAQRALKLEMLLIRRNKQLAESIKTQASSFNLPEPALSPADDVDAEAVWQGHDSLVGQLSELFRAEQQTKTELQQAYQAEVEKLAEKEAQLLPMQARLDIQLDRILKLEASVEEQKEQLLQQQGRAQQHLAEVVQQHQADLARLAELESQALVWNQSRQQPARQQEPAKQPEVPAQPSLEQPVTIPPVAQAFEPSQAAPAEPVNVVAAKAEEKLAEPAEVKAEPLVTSVADRTGGAGGKFKNLFNNARQQFAKMDQKFGGPSAAAESAEQAPEPEPEVSVEIPEAVTVNSEPQPDAVKTQKGGIAGTFKNLFAKPAAPAEEVSVVEAAEQSSTDDESTLEIQAEMPEQRSGAMKGLFRKWGKKSK